MDIGHSVALVTGANRGIGEAFVEALLDAGASRVYAAARDADSLTDLVARDPARIVPLALDITDPAQVQAAAERAADVTLLINNAGTAQFVGFLAAPDLDAARLDMETNYFCRPRCRGRRRRRRLSRPHVGRDARKPVARRQGGRAPGRRVQLTPSGETKTAGRAPGCFVGRGAA